MSEWGPEACDRCAARDALMRSESRNARTPRGSMCSWSTSQKIGRASCVSVHVRNSAAALPSGASHAPMRSNTPPRTPSATVAAMTTINPPATRSARRSHPARASSESSSAALGVQTVVARLPSEPMKNIGTNRTSAGFQFGCEPADKMVSKPSAAAPQPNSAWIGERQSRIPSVSARRQTRSVSATMKTLRFRSPWPSANPAATEMPPAANHKLLHARKRHASTTPPTNAAMNSGANANTPTWAPPDSVAIVWAGR